MNVLGETLVILVKWTHTVDDILTAFRKEGISADNIAFGSGGGLLQDFTRDTQRFAIKCSAMQIDGKWHDISKNPATDKTKASKAGRLATIQDVNGRWSTITEDNLRWLQTSDSGIHNPGSVFQNFMMTVFEDGKLPVIQTLNDIRKRTNVSSRHCEDCCFSSSER